MRRTDSNLVSIVHDGILDGDEFCGVCLASDADKNVAGIAVVARNVGSTTDGADQSRLSHTEIFARRAASTGYEQPRITFVGENAERPDRRREAHA